ncbi:MAG: glycosyltransferase [Candidatus Muiribacterium halophilum]|uniref:Glycosyltransferase n=1 Tax=Muiribacterium halophilum TaxID=2053465 RepID=A0A2N5ZHK9_MUIH1|nr:MAG: glycosyltransferase [Candidatus Muirbacterium halophilum]
MYKLALIVPCFNEEENIERTANILLEKLYSLQKDNLINKNSFLVFVDDGSSDKTWEKITHLNTQNPKIRGLSFSKNYGHQTAILAGITNFDYDICIMLDADLQQDIDKFDYMINKHSEGFDVVCGVRNIIKSRSIIKSISAKIFYYLMKILNSNVVPAHNDFRLLSAKVGKELRKFNEKNIYIRGLIPDLGFNQTYFNYKIKERTKGETKYTYKKLFALARDGLLSNSEALLTNLIYLVLFFEILPFPKLIKRMIRIFVSCVVLEVIKDIYVQSRNRPAYIIKEKI